MIRDWEEVAALDVDDSSDAWYGLLCMQLTIPELRHLGFFAPLSIKRVVNREWAQRRALDHDLPLGELLAEIDRLMSDHLRQRLGEIGTRRLQREGGKSS